MIRVMLVDDQALFRAGIRMLVASQPDLEVVGEAGDGRAAIEVWRATRPDVVLMDIRMPVMDGIEATAAILHEMRVEASARASSPAAGDRPPASTRIVMLTTFDLDEAAARAIRGGASGFLLKDAEPEFLLAAIRTVHAGNAVIAATATRQLFEHFGASSEAGAGVSSGATAGASSAAHGRAEASTPPGWVLLTDREREIFALAARGLSNAEIAAEEFLSEATVKTHISRVLAKLRLRDRVQLVVFAFEHGLH